MSFKLFHIRLQEVLRYIGERDYPRAIGQIENHISGSIHDTDYEEKQFMQLLIFVDSYKNALKNAVTYLEKGDAERAKRMVGTAINAGKQIVQFSENIVSVLKKEEIDLL